MSFVQSMRAIMVALTLLALYAAISVSAQQTTYDPVAGATVVVSIEYGFDGSPIATVTQLILANGANAPAVTNAGAAAGGAAGAIGNGGRVQDVATSICSTEGCPVDPTTYIWTSWNAASSAVLYTDIFTVSTPPISAAKPTAVGTILPYADYAAANPVQAQAGSAIAHAKRSYTTLAGLVGSAVLAIAAVSMLL